jgi:hypothetical protein
MRFFGFDCAFLYWFCTGFHHENSLFFFSVLSYIFFVQERAKAEAENRPVPPLHDSADVRSLSTADFKFAHEQVLKLHQLVSMRLDLLIGTLEWYQ